jgi:hypothetical protein
MQPRQAKRKEQGLGYRPDLMAATTTEPTRAVKHSLASGKNSKHRK